VPAVRGERLAAVREWLEVGLPPVLLHHAVLRGRRAGRAALGQPEAGSADGGPGVAVLEVGRSRPGGCRLGSRMVTSLVAQVSQLPKRS
jgi:hypothetical protein